MDSPTAEHVLEFVRDDRHFTARALKQLHEATGCDREFLAVVIAIPVALYLMAGAYAHFIANALLTIVPIVLSFVFVEESPRPVHLVIYWSCYGFLSLFDNVLREMPAYYLTKVCLMACMFLQPYCWVVKLTDLLHAMELANKREELIPLETRKPQELAKEDHDQADVVGVLLPQTEEVRKAERRQTGSGTSTRSNGERRDNKGSKREAGHSQSKRSQSTSAREAVSKAKASSSLMNVRTAHEG